MAIGVMTALFLLTASILVPILLQFKATAPKMPTTIPTSTTSTLIPTTKSLNESWPICQDIGGNTSLIGNGRCNRININPDCNFDGGDCCHPDWINNGNCEKEYCLDQDIEDCKPSKLDVVFLFVDCSSCPPPPPPPTKDAEKSPNHS